MFCVMKEMCIQTQVGLVKYSDTFCPQKPNKVQGCEEITNTQCPIMCCVDYIVMCSGELALIAHIQLLSKLEGSHSCLGI